MNKPSLIAAIALSLTFAFIVAACDSDFSGSPFDNQSPNTQLSVRDSSLVDNLTDDERLSSSVFASWSGDDSDGFVASYELRFYQVFESPGVDDLWMSTTRNDSLILLPIPRGEKAADVVFEVRAIDNSGLRDPSPARTVFPIQNSPPEIRFSIFELPPDTTFGVFSMAWVATDPEGPESLDRIEVSFNDTTSFVPVPADNDFVTFVADVDRSDPTQAVTDARIYFGRGFQTTSLTVPGLLLDSDNTVYIRAVDQTDTSSVRQEFTWYVKKSNSSILYVNDFRKANFPLQQNFHIQLLEEYMPDELMVDVWDLSTPFVTGSGGNVPRSNQLPSTPQPALLQFLAGYDHIYWVSTNTINSVTANNLPFVIGGMDLFFENGGTIMVHSPVTLPPDPEDNLGNPALLLLPISDLVSFPDSLRPTLRIQNGTPTSAISEVPGTGQSLPVILNEGLILTTLPYAATGPNVVPLMETSYTYVTTGSAQGPWTGITTVASMSADRRVGLFTLPLVSETSGEIRFADESGNTEAARDAVKLMLDGLNFPKR